MRALRMAGLSLLLAACGGNGGGDASAPDATGALKIEAIATDAAAVQALAPSSIGKSDGGQASGLLGYVPGTQPKRLVVFCHGLGHTVEASWYQAVLDFADANTVVVTTNYRDNLKLPILRAAHDTLAATLYARQRFPSIETTYLLGVSFGGAVSGTAITEAQYVSPDGGGLYDYWIDVEGLSNPIEAWTEAKAVSPEYAGYLEEEDGGTPLTALSEYQRRSAVLHATDMAALGLRAATVVHDVNDGLVVYNQGHEMATALLAVGIPVQVFEVIRVADGQDPGTTGTAALAALLGLDDPNNLVHLAGHGDEGDYAHPVIRTGFEQLRQMLDGTYDFSTPYGEHVVDDGG
jgi:hypothetical protein